MCLIKINNSINVKKKKMITYFIITTRHLKKKKTIIDLFYRTIF